MTKHRLLHLCFLLAASAVLGACGGSSSSSPPVVNPPAPPPATESLTVTGFVTDMPIPNATVVLTVNGQEFTAPNPTGADGSFQVEIETTDPDALVECVAFDPTGPARFSALLNNFAGLAEEAGDGIAQDVNITNVTTAQYLLAQELTDDGSIDSLDELQDVAALVDPDELLQLSAAIKVVVDSLEGVVLPAEFDDVQELAQAIIDNTTTFIDDIEAVNPGIIDDAIEEVINDGFATVPFEDAMVPGVYIDTDGDDVMVLFEDGTGVSGEEELDGQLLEDVTWSVADSSLEIVFTETQDIDTAVLLNEAGNVRSLFVTSIEDGVADDEPSTFSVVHLAFDADGFDAVNIPGSYRGAEDDDTEFTVFLNDGSGYDIDIQTGVQDDFFTWEVNDAGELIITDDGVINGDDDILFDDREVIRLLEGSADTTLNLLVMEYELDGDALLEIEAFPAVYTSEIMTGPMPDMANTLLLEGKTYGYTDGNETGLVTFGANGVFSEVWQEYDDDFGPEFDEEEGEWWIDENAILYITFVEDDGVAETDTASVVSGLGGDRMIVLTDDDGVNNELVLDLVVPFVADDVTGTWQFADDGSGQVETVTFDADGTGTYLEDGVLDDSFDWVVNSAGTLVVTLDDEPGAAVWTDNFHKLADSTTNNLHVFTVFRIDGQLVNDADDPNGPPQVIIEENLTRQD